MKTLTAGASTEIAKALGTKPTNIVEIDWSNEGQAISYSDKELTGSLSRILTFDVVSYTESGTIGQAISVNVTLDDSDGEIKGIFDTQDVQKSACTVYQYFTDLPITDKFIIFKGEISTPIVWNEENRTLSFTILSEIEDKEVGFSPEEGQFDFVAKEAVGQAWPLAFGNVLHVPATKVKQYAEGELLETMCIVDPSLAFKLRDLITAYYQQKAILQFYQIIGEAAKAISPPATVLKIQYIKMIILEDRFGKKLRERRADYKHWKEIQKDHPGGWNLMTKKQIDNRVELEKGNIQTQLINIQIMRSIKQNVINKLKILEHEVNVRQEAEQKKLEASAKMFEIYGQIRDVQLEICKQEKCQKLQVEVLNGKDFDQGVPLKLIIKGVKFTGTFTGQTLNLVPYAEPKFENLAVAAHQGEVNECGDISELAGLDVFWLVDASVNLTGMYLLVTKKGGTRRHIIKVVEQDGAKVTFELVEFDENNKGGSRGSGTTKDVNNVLPAFAGSFAQAQGADLQGVIEYQKLIKTFASLTAPTLALLVAKDVEPLNDREINDLRKIEGFEAKELKLDTPAINIFPSPANAFTIVGQDVLHILAAASTPLAGWFDGTIFIEEIPDDLFWKAEPGAKVNLVADDNDLYVCNILPSTIKSVMAYRTFEGERVLAPVPQQYYTKNEAEVLGPITATTLKVKPKFNLLQREGWEQQIYVSMESSVGPNVVDILKHLIATYTDKTHDAATFDALETQFGSLYPANFCYFDRRDVKQALNEIAWQARCVIFDINDVFYLIYVSEEPTSVRTLTESDIKSVNVSLSSTDTLITKITAKYQEDYLPKDPLEVVVRHNEIKYGKNEEEIDFYIYNIKELVEKSATFWLIRKCNAWKEVTIEVFLNQIDLEIQDCITLNLVDNFFSTGAIKGIIKEVGYDSVSNSIALRVWIPVRAGEMTQYQFAWPADLAADVEFPPEEDVASGVAGGSGIGKTISGFIQGS